MGIIEGLNGVDIVWVLKFFFVITFGERNISLFFDFFFFNSLFFEVGVIFLIFGDFIDCVGGGFCFFFLSCFWEFLILLILSFCREIIGVKFVGIILEIFGENEIFFFFKFDFIIGFLILFVCNIGYVFMGEDCDGGIFLFLVFLGILFLFLILDVILGGEFFDLVDFDFDIVVFIGGDRFFLVFDCLRDDVMGFGFFLLKLYRLFLFLEEILVVVFDLLGLVFFLFLL